MSDSTAMRHARMSALHARWWRRAGNYRHARNASLSASFWLRRHNEGRGEERMS